MGQNWGIPLYKWKSRASASTTGGGIRCGNIHKVFHLFRIDHVLGFFRIYSFPWQPKYNDKFLPMTEEEAAKHTDGRLPHFQPYADDTEKGAAFNEKQGEEIIGDGYWKLRVTRQSLQRTSVLCHHTCRWLLDRLKNPRDYYKIPHFLREKDHSFVSGKTYSASFSGQRPRPHDHDPVAKMWREFAGEVDAGNYTSHGHARYQSEQEGVP